MGRSRRGRERWRKNPGWREADPKRSAGAPPGKACADGEALGLVPLVILGTACPCHHLGWNGGPLHLSQPCRLLSWAPQTQPTWDSPRAWPLSLSPSVLTPSPISCTAPCWARTPFSSPCLPAPATLRHAAPTPAPPGGRLRAAGAGTPGAGHAGARGDGRPGGLSSQRRAGREALGLAPGHRL